MSNMCGIESDRVARVVVPLQGTDGGVPHTQGVALGCHVVPRWGTESAHGGTESAHGGMESAHGGMESAQGGMESAQGGTESAQGGMGLARAARQRARRACPSVRFWSFFIMLAALFIASPIASASVGISPAFVLDTRTYAIGSPSSDFFAESNTFVLDTRFVGTSVAVQSSSFTLDTRGILLTVRDGFSGAFELDTRTVFTQHPPVVEPPPSRETHTEETLPELHAAGTGESEEWHNGQWVSRPDSFVYSAQNRNVYIIAHGWQPPVLGVDDLAEIDWMTGMAERLAQVDPTAIVVGWNWLDAARAVRPGTARGNIARESNRLAERVLKRGLIDANHIHWIGHSFGSGVVSYAALNVAQKVSPLPPVEPPMRVTTLDPPENAWSVLGFAILHLGAYPVANLHQLGIPVDNYMSEVGRRYDRAVNFDLRQAADAYGTPGAISDHALAANWFWHSITSQSTPFLPSEGLMPAYFHYYNPEDASGVWGGLDFFVPNSVGRFWAGVDTKGFNFSSSATEGNWRLARTTWANFTLREGIPFIGEDDFVLATILNPPGGGYWPILMNQPEYEEVIALASNAGQSGRPGFRPYLMEQQPILKDGEPISFDPTYTTVGPNPLADAGAWLASSEGDAYSKDDMLFLTANPEAYAVRTLAIPDDASVLRFEHRFEGISDGDRLFVYFDDELVYFSEAFSFMEGDFFPTGWIDIESWAGLEVELTIFTERDDATTAVEPLFVTIRDFDIASEQPSYWVLDSDGDGLDNYEEVFIYGTDPDNPDTSGNGIPDGWLVKHGFDPLDPAVAHQDADGDGYTNLEEYLMGTDPLDPNDPDPFEPDVFVDITGRVTMDGSGLEGVTISAEDGPAVMTDQSGEFFLMLPEGYSGSLTPSKDGYTFTPESRIYNNLNSHQTAQNFTANPSTPGDINGTGVVNAVDVQLVINAALGIDIDYDADVNGDGVVNAVDVQLVINAALGIDIEV